MAVLTGGARFEQFFILKFDNQRFISKNQNPSSPKTRAKKYFMRHKLLLLFSLAFALAKGLNAQRNLPPDSDTPRNKGNAILLHLSLGAQLPAGDLADRFGLNGTFGGNVEFITAHNLILGAEAQGIFGSTVREDPLEILRTPEGDIIGNNRLIASVVLRQRGMYFGGYVGKLFVFDEIERSGLRVTLGGGWLQHRIRVQDDSRSVTQLTGEYLKGYDRLAGGFALQQFIGWQQLGAQRRANWMLGLDLSQGFTETRRDWDFSSMQKLTGRRLDLRFGVRLAWALPFYRGKSSEIYY
jgi:hypothetical protein